MQPQFPLYIVSKGRADSRLTSKALEAMGVPYQIVVEAQEVDSYAAVIDSRKILVLDKAYQEKYDAFDKLGMTKSKGPGPARNFVWDDSIKRGFAWHWVMDDNIRGFYRLNRNRKIPLGDGTGFKVMEDFVLRYRNIGMAGPSYTWLTKRKQKLHPIIMNTRIYSCNLIRNDIPYRWRGRYNEDTDLSIRMLKDGWCTVQFNAFLQYKTRTQQMKGGNTEEFYAKEGTVPKSQMLVDMHPDVATITWRFGRWHHLVNYKQFKNHLIRKPDISIAAQTDNYGLVIKEMQ